MIKEILVLLDGFFQWQHFVKKPANLSLYSTRFYWVNRFYYLLVLRLLIFRIYYFIIVLPTYFSS